MNSDNLSEKAFDAEIKGHLENSSVTFDPESWEKMSQKLDSVFPNNNSGNSGFFELLIVAFLLSAFFFWNVGTFSQTNASIVGSDNTVDQISDNSSERANISRISESGDVSNRVSDVSNHAELEDQGSKQDNVQENQASNSESIFLNSEDNSAAKEPGTAITNSNYNQTSTVQVLLATNDPFTDKMGDGTNLERAVTFVAPNTEDIEPFEQQPLPDQIKGTNLNIEDPPVVKVSSSPWFLGFGYGPDVSLVGFSEVTRPGTNLGILLEYQLNRRWSINSGITYSRKNYTAKGEDYHPPKGFWDYGFVPDMTDATCEVIDIPINIRYYFRPAKSNRLFASTGLSTYLMLTEDYKYQYGRDDPQHLVLSWSGKNENQHYFAIYNLSVGYQRSMGKQWFLEIEPFVKLPLTGVGFGEVDLWSTGALFSLKYNF